MNEFFAFRREGRGLAAVVDDWRVGDIVLLNQERWILSLGHRPDAYWIDCHHSRYIFLQFFFFSALPLPTGGRGNWLYEKEGCVALAISLDSCLATGRMMEFPSCTLIWPRFACVAARKIIFTQGHRRWSTHANIHLFMFIVPLLMLLLTVFSLFFFSLRIFVLLLLLLFLISSHLFCWNFSAITTLVRAYDVRASVCSDGPLNAAHVNRWVQMRAWIVYAVRVKYPRGFHD